MKVPVIVIGGGPAGLAAACALRDGGCAVTLLEREAALGGVPRHCGHTGFGLRELGWPVTGPAYARALAARAAGIELRTGVTVTALLPGGVVETAGADGPQRLAAERVVLALGVRERPASARLVGGDRPWGVTTTGALQQFVYLENRRPFRRAVIVGTELVSFSLLLTMRHGRIRPVAMLEEGERIVARRPGDLVARHLFGVPVLTGTRLVAVHGRPRVAAVEVERAGRRELLDCDGVVFSGRFVPEAALLRAGHLAVDPGTGGPVVDQEGRCSDPAYAAAGNLLRPVETAGVAHAEGRAAGRALIAELAGARPPVRRILPVRAGGALAWVMPQRLALPAAEGALRLTARAARPTRGLLVLRIGGKERWSRHLSVLPERRITVPVAPGWLERADAVELALEPA
jgi:NADPH-dependent 2,4-dienoyl-CoA reductase/sulfur reductase-like enzyme